MDGVLDAGQGEKGMKKFLQVMAAVAGEFNFDARLGKMDAQVTAAGVDGRAST